jgi:hypothetical protein
MVKSPPNQIYDAFCDTSFLLSYCFAFGDMHDRNNGVKRDISFPFKFFPHSKRITKTIPIAEVLFSYGNKISLVYNYGVLFEFIEKIAEENLRQSIIGHVPLALIQNTSKKNYSAFAKWLIEDCKRVEAFSENEITPLQALVYNCFAGTEFEDLETSLWGIDFTHQFHHQDLSLRFNQLAYYARCQIGFADIHHLLSAESLGCKYFITYDSDFKKMKHEIQKDFGLDILSTPEEILKII